MYCQHLVSLAIAMALMGLVACESTTPQADYTKELLRVATAEAGQIPAVKDRFRRYLNVADAQIENGERIEARQTLDVAEAELRSSTPEDFDRHTCLAGWVSLSELYSNAYRDYEHDIWVSVDNNAHAKAALKQAIDMLHSIQPESLRAYFIRSIARQIREISGETDACKALVEGAGWAGQIQNLRERQRAYRHIACDLFACQDVPDARDVLRRDPDPAWRTDTLVGLTMNYRGQVPFLRQFTPIMVTNGPGALSPSEKSGTPDTRPSEDDFGTPLDYRSNFAPEQQPRQ